MYRSLTVCVHKRVSKPSCGSGRGDEIAEKLQQALADMGSNLTVARIYCFGLCDDGPNVRLTPGGRFFHNVDPDHLDEILETVRALEAASSDTPMPNPAPAS